MFKFRRELILPLFLQRRITLTTLAKEAGVPVKSVARAVNGLAISPKSVDRIATALRVQDKIVDYLALPADGEIEFR